MLVCGGLPRACKLRASFPSASKEKKESAYRPFYLLQPEVDASRRRRRRRKGVIAALRDVREETTLPALAAVSTVL